MNRMQHWIKWTLFTALFVSFAYMANAQEVKVPKTLRFAGMTLHLTNSAQKQIQSDVNRLRRSETYFRRKVKEVNKYFPLIEKIINEENLPEDFKYLVIQESALVPDAVSSSNAIGYWQFKTPAAEEVGLTINRKVDERMNIAASTHGAARYLKNNNTYFDNWIYALMAYNTGAGGAMNIANEKYYNKNRMPIKGSMHWYVMKFLAHKIAYQHEIGKEAPDSTLFIHETRGGTLKDIARQYNMEKADIAHYNQWLKTSTIPDDKTYQVIIPRPTNKNNKDLVEPEMIADKKKETNSAGRNNIKVDKPGSSASEKPDKNVPDYKDTYTNTSHFPKIPGNDKKYPANEIVEINGEKGIVALPGDDIHSISKRGGINDDDFKKYNDFHSNNATLKGRHVYYLKEKRGRPDTYYHTVEPGENLWSVSQRFGMKLKKLMRYNRIRNEKKIKPGRVLWLRFIRPRRISVEFHDAPDNNTADFSFKIPGANNRNQLPAEEPVQQNKKPIVNKKQKSNTTSSQKKTPDKPVINTEKGKDKQEIVQEESSPSESINTPPQQVENKPVKQNKESAKEMSNNREKRLSLVEGSQKSNSQKNVPVSHSDNPVYHMVKDGETLFSISRQYEVTVDDLKNWNNLGDGEPIKIGQKLVVGHGVNKNGDQQLSFNKEKESDSLVLDKIYKVKEGDTIYKIARMHDVTIKKIMDWNNKNSFDLSINEKIKIYKEKE